jgi:hypothetical protein
VGFIGLEGMMRKLLFIWVLTLFFGRLSSPVFAIQYCKDFLESCNPGGWTLSLKTFDEAYEVPTGSAYEIDIWLNDVPIPLITAGFWVVHDPTNIGIEDVLVYDGSDLPGPWDPGFTTKIPELDGPGTYFVMAGNFDTAASDGDGDIIIAKIQLLCLDSSVSDIVISTIPGFDTVIGDTTVFDPQTIPNTITMTQVA